MKIEKNIPIPFGKENGMTAILRQMEVGDSFEISLTQKASAYAIAAREKVKVTIRNIDGKARVWRTA